MYKITEAQIERLNRVSVNCYCPGEEGKPPVSRLLKLGDLMQNIFKVLNEEKKDD